MKKKILHIITNDKFTSGYINFMMSKMENYEHTFIITKGNFDLDLMDDKYYEKVIVLDNMKEILTKRKKKLMNDYS